MANQDKKSKKGKWGRRAFIVTGGLVGGGLVIGVGGNIYVSNQIKKFSGKGFNKGDSVMNAWVSIAPDNTITVAVPRAEMGQGVYTSLPMLVAEELEVDVNKIKVFHPQPESPYANTTFLAGGPRDVHKGLSVIEKIASFMNIVGTGGSTTIVDGFGTYRAAGATARVALVRAAAEKWGVQEGDCYAEDGHVINKSTKEKLSYGDLAVAASSIEVSEVPAFKAQKDFKVIGKPIARLDVPEKVTGTAEFGIDVRPEGVLFAAIKHPEHLAGVITSIDNITEVEALPGVKKVVMLADGKGVAVIADNTWRAKNATLTLEVTEDSKASEGLSSASISQKMKSIIDNDEMIATPEDEGDVEGIFGKEGVKIIESVYEVPYLAQATMEPLNCTVLVDGEKAKIWVGHQFPSMAKSKVEEITGATDVEIHVTYLGGGFGRRAELDFVEKSAEVAAAMPGVPVQLSYTREEDMRYGMYRPTATSKFKAVVAADGTISAWENKMALQSVMNNSMLRMMPSQAPKPKDDIMTIEGAAHLPYAMDNRKVAFGHLDVPVQVGNWRSVGSSQNGWFTEAFMDECATAAGQDPYLFRKSKLGAFPRFEAVLDKVAEISGWKNPKEEGVFMGIALHKSFGSIVGEVAKIRDLGDKKIAIEEFFCVIDCGRIVNPDTVEAQMQSGIVYGLSAAMYGKITIGGGKIIEGNFPEYEMVRMNVSPQMTVHIMEVDEYPGGVGEPGTPPAAPALTNAIYAATGDRVRELPLVKSGYTFV